jgi:hypothetical protein
MMKEKPKPKILHQQNRKAIPKKPARNRAGITNLVSYSNTIMYKQNRGGGMRGGICDEDAFFENEARQELWAKGYTCRISLGLLKLHASWYNPDGTFVSSEDLSCPEEILEHTDEKKVNE